MVAIEWKITFLPINRTIKARTGVTILQAARKAGIPIVTRCGGNASCFMCKVKILDQSGLQEMTEQEKNKLSFSAEDGIRLSCQAKICGDVIVELPPDPLRKAIERQLQRQKEEDTLW